MFVIHRLHILLVPVRQNLPIIMDRRGHSRNPYRLVPAGIGCSLRSRCSHHTSGLAWRYHRVKREPIFGSPQLDDEIAEKNTGPDGDSAFTISGVGRADTPGSEGKPVAGNAMERHVRTPACAQAEASVGLGTSAVSRRN